jgi:hypothetical protein
LQLTADEQVAIEQPDLDEKTMKLAFASTAMAIGSEILAEHNKILQKQLDSFKSVQHK